jgi:nitroreductase
MLTVAEAIQQRRSIRSFKRTPVSEEMILQMLEAARLAPSGGNTQPWRFVVVTDSEEKKELRQLCFNQAFIEEAGVVFVACADLSSYSKETHQKRHQEAIDAGVFPASSLLNDPRYYRRIIDSIAESDLATFITSATANTYIAAEHLVLMATALGLGSCWVGAISDHDAVKTLLSISKDIMLVVLVAVGYTDIVPAVRPHLPLENILLRPFPDTTDSR